MFLVIWAFLVWGGGDFKRGMRAYAVGFLQSKVGEASLANLRDSMQVRMARAKNAEELVSTWSIIKKNPLNDSLSGMSGGPVIDEKGEVVGVVSTENSRRGRINASTIESIKGFMRQERVQPENHHRVYEMNDENFIAKAQEIRGGLCRV